MDKNSVFNTYAEEYEEWFEKNKFAYLSEIEALKKVMPEGKGLEVGVGTGRFAGPLGVDTGIDPSENMLKIAESRGVKTFHGRGEDLPFEDNEFDFVLLAFTLCFVDDPKKVIAEAKRVLKDNGKIIVGVIDKNSALGKIYQDKKQNSRFYGIAKFYSTEEVIELLKNYDFKNIRTLQTLFDLPGNLNKIDDVKEGHGKGGFVVVSGSK
jgi:ubiquinone/menaquinone biosynthesis C-methylase UbiE